MLKDDFMDKGFYFWLNEYYEKFGDYFPTENYACDAEQMILKIKNYIANNEQIKEQNEVIY